MKFGGTSVESPTPSSASPASSSAQQHRQPSRGGVGHGQDHQQAARHRRRRGWQARSMLWLRSTSSSAIICATVFPGELAAPISTGSSTSISRSSTELVKGLGGAGRTDAALHRRHFQLSASGSRAYIVSSCFSSIFGMTPCMSIRATSSSPTTATRRPVRCSRKPTPPLAATVPPAAQATVVVMGGFIASTEDGVTTTLGRGGSDYHRVHRGRRTSAPKRSRSGPTSTAC